MPQKSPHKALKRRILERDGSICRYCGSPVEGRELVFEHSLPVSRGGIASDANIVIACRICNYIKSTRNHEEFTSFMKSMIPAEDLACELGIDPGSVVAACFVAGVKMIHSRAGYLIHPLEADSVRRMFCDG
jgi:hypothetical protein